MLVDTAWDKPGYRASINPRILIVGYDPSSVQSLRWLGWKAWVMKTTNVMLGGADLVGGTRRRQFPFQKHVFDLVLYELMLPENPFELRQVVVDVGRAIKIGGYFVVPNGHDEHGAFKAHNFWKVPLNLRYHNQWFAIYQKKSFERAA